MAGLLSYDALTTFHIPRWELRSGTAISALVGLRVRAFPVAGPVPLVYGGLTIVRIRRLVAVDYEPRFGSFEQ